MPSSPAPAPAQDPVFAQQSRAEQASAAEKSSYGQILRSTALVGGSQVINIAVGLVRGKAMAILLGPAGFGLAGLYMSVVNLVQSVAGMGVNSSGVRQIAEAVGSGNSHSIARTALVLRRVSVALGILGALLLILFAPQVSRLTFGSNERTGDVALLSAVVLFQLMSQGQMALIQGMRRIADLVMINTLGTLAGAFAAIVLIYFFREQGVVPALVAVAGLTLLISWRHSRRISLPPPAMTASEMGREAAALLKLGFAFMSSGLMMMGSAYGVRILILQKLNLEATGLYQAAWTISGLYVGLILQAMGADFYPRLTACASNNAECNRLVNEQARISLLLAGPGVLATITFAPVIISTIYDLNFAEAVPLLRWTCLGIALRVISWPMGLIIVAKGRQGLFFWSELAWTIVHLGLAWIFLGLLGLDGTGIAFFGSYVFHVFMIYWIVNRISGYKWSHENQLSGFLYVFLISVVFSAFFVFSSFWATSIGVLLVALSVFQSLRSLSSIAPRFDALRFIQSSWSRVRPTL